MFRDRAEAGQRLGEWLRHLRGRPDLEVLGIARGGAPVAAEVAGVLRVPWTVIAVRRLISSACPGLTMGAVAEGGYVSAVGNRAMVSTNVDTAQVERMAVRLRQGEPLPELADRTVILVDDGAVTGATARAACRAVRAADAARIILAVPLIAPCTVAGVCDCADEVVRVVAIPRIERLGDYYRKYPSITEADVVTLLATDGIDAATA